MFKIVEFSHLLIHEYLKQNTKENLLLVDATCGAGNDTLFMAKELNNRGTIIAYDIQEIAIHKTKQLLQNNQFNNIIYKLESHKNITEIPDLVIYNFGYLPNTAKKITTTLDSSLASVMKMIELISTNPNLFIILVLYPGHTEGKREAIALDHLCKTLPNKEYLVSKYQNYNRSTSPFILTISKNKKSH